MRVHAIICTYLGDGELDIGKSARWVQWFTDTVFFYDANSSSDARKYVIDYAKSWPDCQFAYHPNASGAFHTDPTVMRRMAFAAADAAWKYDPGDWVIYVDGTEGLSTDVPLDALEWTTNPPPRFRYLYDEATAANAAGKTFLGVSFRVLLNQGTVTEHDYLIQPALGDRPDNHAVWWQCDPRYLDPTNVPSTRYLLRMARVSYLRTAVQATWTAMDTFGTAASFTGQQAAHVGILSYAYTRYSEVDYHDPSLWVQANDEGWTNRVFMQGVPGRNIASLPSVYSTADPPGYNIVVPPGPARITVTSVSGVNTFQFTGHVTRESGNETYAWQYGDTQSGTGQTVTHAYAGAGPYTVVLTVHDPDVGADRTAQVVIAPGSLTPITPQAPPPPGSPPNRMLSGPYCYYVNQVAGQYMMVFVALWRLNPRDGVWWQNLVIGPPPIDPMTGQAAVDPNDWNNQHPQDRGDVVAANQSGPVSETLITVLEGVLLTGDNKIDRHIAMYNGLSTQFRTVMLTTLEREEAKRLMKLYQVRFDILMDKDTSILTDTSWKVSAVRECLAAAWRVGLYLDTDAEAVRHVYAMGVSALLLSHHLLRPAWLPGEGPPRAWDALVSFQEAQDERTADVRARDAVYEVGGGRG